MMTERALKEARELVEKADNVYVTIAGLSAYQKLVIDLLKSILLVVLFIIVEVKESE
jgi:hypothetical protein